MIFVCYTRTVGSMNCCLEDVYLFIEMTTSRVKVTVLAGDEDTVLARSTYRLADVSTVVVLKEELKENQCEGSIYFRDKSAHELIKIVKIN
jgi:hypothetical protein